MPSAFGKYASGEYQLGRRWFAGGRYDWSERAIDPLLKDTIRVGDSSRTGRASSAKSVAQYRYTD